MCWAAADRMALVASRHAPHREQGYREAAARIRDEIAERAWNAELGSFVGHYGGTDLDASLLQMATLRLFPRDEKRLHRTVDALRISLSQDGWLFRYQSDDGFGKPKVAFIICTFWLVEALAVLGRLDEAKAVMKHVHAGMSPLGLLSEDYETANLRMWGNFPQAYSHVGLIRAAYAAAPRWSEVV
jgi:GH15 family glucan-1,4-alpha-glucosidase